MADSPLIKRLRERAKSLSSKAVEELLTSDKRSDALGNAIRRVQNGRRTIDEGATRLLGILGVASREDLNVINRRIGRIRKRLQSVLDDLEG